MTGSSLRDRGCQLAESGSKLQSLKLRLEILALAASGNAFSADDLSGADESRSCRVGAAFLALSKRGFIEFTGECRRATRVSRHAGLQRVWQAADVTACRVEAERIRLEAGSLAPPLTQGQLFDEPTTSHDLKPLGEVLRDGLSTVIARLGIEQPKPPDEEAGGNRE